MAGKKIDIMESELERENSGLLLVSDLLDGKSDEMLIGESGFVSLQSQLPLPASDLAMEKTTLLQVTRFFLYTLGEPF